MEDLVLQPPNSKPKPNIDKTINTENKAENLKPNQYTLNTKP